MRRPGDAASALAAEPIGCADRAPDVTLYVDGELAEAERVAMEVHVAACAECRAAARWQQAFRDMLRAKAVPAPVRAPASLRARLSDALEAEDGPPKGFAIPARLRRVFAPIPLAAAGATALGVSAWLWFGAPSDDMVREIVARHSRRLPLEFESNDPQSLEHWLSDKVDFRVRVPRVKGGPFSLLGARLSHVRDHSAVYLLYGTPQSPQRRVSVLVFDDPAQAFPVAGQRRRVDDHDVVVANSAGYNVAVWKQNEVVYSLVSDGDEDVLELVKAANP